MNVDHNPVSDIPPAADASGRIDACTNCSAPLPLVLPQASKPAGAWICTGCGAQYEGLLDPGASTELFTNIRPTHFPVVSGEFRSLPLLVQPPAGPSDLGDPRYHGSERRRAARHPISIPVALVPVDPALVPRGDTIVGRTRNLSTSGMAILSPRFIPQRLLIVGFGAPQAHPVQLLMRVVECRNRGNVYEIRGPFLMRLEAAANVKSGDDGQK